MKSEQSKWGSGSGRSTGAPSAQAHFSSLPVTRFGKMGLHALAPAAHPLQAFSQLRSSEEFTNQKVAGFAHLPIRESGGVSLTVVPRDPEGRRALRARYPSAYRFGSGHALALSARVSARRGALLGERPKRVTGSDGAHPAALDMRALTRTQG